MMEGIDHSYSGRRVEEQQAVERARAGDPNAERHLYEAHVDWVYRSPIGSLEMPISRKT